MRKNFYSFPETITAENLEELKELVGDTKVGYSAVVLIRDLEYKGRMPTYKIFVSTSEKAAESIKDFVYQTGKTNITHSHMFLEEPARIFVHSHKRGDIPHGHNGAVYNKVEK